MNFSLKLDAETHSGLLIPNKPRFIPIRLKKCRHPENANLALKLHENNNKRVPFLKKATLLRIGQKKVTILKMRI